VRALGAAPIGNADDHCYPYCTRTVKKESDHPVWLDGVTLYGAATLTHHTPPDGCVTLTTQGRHLN
jgi:hypothetical protein